MLQVFQFIEKKFGLLLLVSIATWLFLPEFAKIFYPYLLYLIQFMLFLSFLKISFVQIKQTIKRWKLIVLIVICIMILCPMIFYFITTYLYPEIAVWILILTAIPIAMSASAIANILQWNASLTLVLTVVTTLVCPFTIPFLIKLLVWSDMKIELLKMFMMLAKTIFIPFVIALIFKKFFTTTINRTNDYYWALSVISLMLVVMAPMAIYRDYFLVNPIKTIPMLIYLTITSISLYIIWWFMWYKMKMEDKISLSISFGNMNMTLSILFATTFFWPAVLLPIIIFQLPRNFMLVPFEYIVKQINKKYLR